jgi:hypothetical protein
MQKKIWTPNESTGANSETPNHAFALALTNWRPITLLNLSYKFFAKAIQLRLQPILMEIISCKQSVFLLLRFILDNILLT